MRTLGKAAECYTRKNLRMLYDAISTLADGVGGALGEPPLLSLFMPPLLVKWQQFADGDRELMPLMEVFTALATALGEPPQPHTKSSQIPKWHIPALKGNHVQNLVLAPVLGVLPPPHIKPCRQTLAIAIRRFLRIG